jgi:hypothetical protein
MRLVQGLGLSAFLAGALVWLAFSQPQAAVGQVPAARTYYVPVTETAPAQELAAPVPVAPGAGYVAHPYQWQPEASQLAQQYIKAEKEEEKRQLRRKLTDVLTKQFDAHLEQQKKELEALEKQIERLRSTLDKRREAKDKIIERRIEQLVEEAEGLGWNTPNQPPAFYGVPNSNFYPPPVRVNPPTEKKRTNASKKTKPRDDEKEESHP